MKLHRLIAWIMFGLLFCCGRVALGGNEPGRTIYLDNNKGSDQFDGTSASRGEGNIGPVATIAHASDILEPCGKLVIANTGTPYRGSLKLVAKGGTPQQPLVIEGNDATLEGLEVVKPSEWTVEHDDLLSRPCPGPPYGYFVVTDGAAPVWAKSLDAIKPGETYFNKQQATQRKLYYRLPEGKRIEDVKLELPIGGLGAGVEIVGANNIVVRNLKCRYFSNDGFNIQFECEGLRFEHIEGYLNGDQGFSCHSSVTCVVIDGNFHENDSGIADTVFSRTSFFGVKVRANRSFGILFEGGEHSIVHGEIVDNPVSITLEDAKNVNHLPGLVSNPYTNCRLFLRDTLIQGGAHGLKVKENSSASVNYCVFRDQPSGIIMTDPEARLHMINSIVASRGDSITCATGNYWGDYNCWTSPKAILDGKGCDVLQIDPKRHAEAHSIVADPRFINPGGAEIDPASPARGKAYVDLGDVQWLHTSHILDPKTPPEKFPERYPESYPDIGCVNPR